MRATPIALLRFLFGKRTYCISADHDAGGGEDDVFYHELSLHGEKKGIAAREEHARFKEKNAEGAKHLKPQKPECHAEKFFEDEPKPDGGFPYAEDEYEGVGGEEGVGQGDELADRALPEHLEKPKPQKDDAERDAKNRNTMTAHKADEPFIKRMEVPHTFCA